MASHELDISRKATKVHLHVSSIVFPTRLSGVKIAGVVAKKAERWLRPTTYLLVTSGVGRTMYICILKTPRTRQLSVGYCSTVTARVLLRETETLYHVLILLSSDVVKQ